MALASRDRLNRMKTDKDEFLNLLRGQRKEMFKVRQQHGLCLVRLEKGPRDI